MVHGAPAIFVALEHSGLAAAIRQSTWLYPAANIAHIVWLVIFAGAVAAMDLRLIGWLGAAPARLDMRLRIVAATALLGMAVTGFMLFAAEATHLAMNPVFQFKAFLVVLGVLNVALYELWAKNRMEMRAARAAGWLSLGIWLAVAACGRSIAYF
jgi:hypothetical protein